MERETPPSWQRRDAPVSRSNILDQALQHSLHQTLIAAELGPELFNERRDHLDALNQVGTDAIHCKLSACQWFPCWLANTAVHASRQCLADLVRAFGKHVCGVMAGSGVSPVPSWDVALCYRCQAEDQT